MGIKHSVDETFFNSWNKRMAYVLGYIYADGNVLDLPYMRAKYVSVTSIDIESIERIRKWLNSEHRIIERRSSWKNGHNTYTLRIGSHGLYNALFNLGVYPNKSLTVEFPEVPSEYLRDFVRGNFDGDGCVHLEKITRKDGRIHARKLNIIFTSGSKIFLVALENALYQTISVKKQKIIKAWTAYQLRYGTKDSILLYNELYKDVKKGEYLERKHQVFEDFFRLHKGHVVKKSTRRSAKALYVGANPTMASATLRSHI